MPKNPGRKCDVSHLMDIKVEVLFLSDSHRVLFMYHINRTLLEKSN